MSACVEKCDSCQDMVDPSDVYGAETITADGIMLKQISLPKSGMLVPQHAHHFDHVTMVASGGLCAWAGDEFLGDFVAPIGIFIRANVKHKFLTLMDNTVIYCVHRLRDGQIAVAEEHQLDRVA